jgi:hypothetical protein
MIKQHLHVCHMKQHQEIRATQPFL